MKKEELEKLKELADKTGNCGWYVQASVGDTAAQDGVFIHDGNFPKIPTSKHYSPTQDDVNKLNFISNANPAFILKLIESYEKLEADKGSNDNDYIELCKRFGELERKYEKSLEVNRFYADEIHWSYDPYPTAVEDDGKRAREFLRSIE